MRDVVHWVLVSVGFHRQSGLGVVGVLVTSARTVLDEWVGPEWAVGVLEVLAGVGFVGQQGSGQASSIFVQCVGLQPW